MIDSIGRNCKFWLMGKKKKKKGCQVSQGLSAAGWKEVRCFLKSSSPVGLHFQASYHGLLSLHALI